MRLLLCLLLIVFTCRGAQGREITVAAYNLQNAFDVFDDPYTADEKTRVKPRRDLDAIGRALLAMDADIVAFSEVENAGILQALAREIVPQLGYTEVVVLPSNSGRGINLGVLSRLPIRSATSYRWQTLSLPDGDRAWRFARDLLHVQIALDDEAVGHAAVNSGETSGPTSGGGRAGETSGGGRAGVTSGGAEESSGGAGATSGGVLHLFPVHLKSKRSTEGDPQSIAWRSAEALRIRQIVGGLLDDDPDTLALVLGDFNANPGDPAMRLLLDAPTSPPLRDLHAGLPAERRITYPSTRYPNTIFDYLLATPALARRVVDGSARILTDPDVTGGSDHRPVHATFVID